MGLVDRILAPVAANPGPTDDFWYQPLGTTSSSGFRINTESALKVSTVYACVSLLSETIATLPFHIFRRLPDGGKQRENNHAIAQVIAERPNVWQTSFDWRALMMACLLLKGNALSKIIPGQRGFVDQLIPMHPDRVTVKQVRSTGRLIYKHALDNGQVEELDQDKVFHLRAFSLDGIWGRSVIEFAVDTIGLSLSQDAYAAALSGGGAKHAGVLSHPGRLGEEAQTRLKRQIDSQTTGMRNAGKTLVLEEGMTWQQVTMSANDAQAVEMMDHSAGTIAGQWFRVPPHMVGLTDRSTSWGTGIAEQSAGFVRYTLMPWVVRYEQSITRDLIIAPQTYYPKFGVEGLLRGTPVERAQFYALMSRGGARMTPNEIRGLEDLDPVPWGNDPVPLPNESPRNIGMPPAGAMSAQAYLLAEESAGRVVRKELAAITKAANRCASNSAAFEAFVREFYADHVEMVSTTMKISEADATAYCEGQRDAVIWGGAKAMESWEDEVPPRLATLALGVEHE